MTKCSFKFCKSAKTLQSKNYSTTYFRFPKHLIRREKWIEVVRRQREEPSFEPNTASLVCSKHFHKNDFYTTDKGSSRLRDTAVPILDPVNLNAINAEDKNVIEDNISTKIIEDLSNTNKLIYQYSIGPTNSTNCEIIGKETTKEADLDMLFEDNTSSSFENAILPSTSYGSDTSNDGEEVVKIINIEFEESSNNSEEDKNDSVIDEDLGFFRTRDMDKFGEQVAAMLKKIPIHRALDLQPRIVNLITSVINEDQTTMIKIEDGYSDGN